MKFIYPCVVRGYHVYRVYWDLVIGEELTTQPDPDGRKFGDKHSVAVMKDGVTVGHLPKDISCLAKYFIVHGGTIKCKVTGKKKPSKMLRGALYIRIWYEGKCCCSDHAIPQRQTEVSWQNMVEPRLGYQKKKKTPFQDKQMSRKNNHSVLSLSSFFCDNLFKLQD